MRSTSWGLAKWVDFILLGLSCLLGRLDVPPEVML
ncbi:hypothetical protein EVA_13868, partial [gut metagenome]